MHKNGTFKRKHTTVLNIFDPNILLNSGRHQMLSKLASLSISSLYKMVKRINFILEKKGKRKVQGMPQSQTATLYRHQEEEDTDKTKQTQIEQSAKSIKISSLFLMRGDRNAKSTENHKNKIIQGKI